MGRAATSKTAASARNEYCTNENATIEYLADKYDTSPATMRKILSNDLFPDPEYTKPKKKRGGRKRSVFIPERLEGKLSHPTTLHRARGQNNTINRFK